MSEPHYYHVATPEGLDFTFIGGPLVDGGDGFVTLTAPDGRPLLRVRREWVRESSRAEAAERILADRRAPRAPLN